MNKIRRQEYDQLWLGFGPSAGKGKSASTFLSVFTLFGCHVMQNFVINIPYVNERSSDLRDLVSLTNELVSTLARIS